MTDTAIRVLLVDDDPDEHILIRDLLQESNNQTYAVDWESLYDTGLKAIGHDQHDVYLIDYRLGEKNGLDLIREAIASGCAKPLIMLTGSADDGIDEAVMKAGAADYLDKSQIGQIHSVMRYDEPKAHGEVVRGQVGDPLLESAIRHVLIREDTQQALNRANALSKSLISSSLDMIVAVDNNRRITEFNPAAERIFGYSRQEALGQPLDIIYGSASQARDVSNHVSKTGTFTGEVLNKRKNGETFISYLSSSVLRDHDGMVLGVMGISRDITEQKQTEKALREATIAAEEAKITAERAEERFRTLVSNIPGATYRCACDSDWRMEFISNEIEIMSGYPASDFLQNNIRTYASIIHPEDTQLVDDAVRDGIKENRPFTIEYRILQKDGSVRHVFEKGRAVLNDDSTVAWLDGAIFDITTQKDTEERYRHLVDNASDLIFETDAHGCFTYLNPTAEKIVGPAHTILGTNYLDLIPEEQHEEIERTTARQVSERITNQYFEFQLNTADGKEIWLGQNVQQVMEGDRVLGYQSVARDITKRKRAEEALEQAKNTAEEANLAKSRFLNAMSHELRTPLNSILGFTELLSGQFFGTLNDKQSEYVALLEASSRHLLELVNDILDLAKLDVGASELHRKNFPPHQLIKESVALMGALFAKKKLEVAVFADPAVDLVYGDTRRCKQVLLNLLSNAVKYSPEGGHIDVRVAPQDDAMLRLSVSDQGVGIPTTNLNRIFDEFYQVDEGRDSQLGGTGIGLALVKRLVELHGGEVGVESEVGVGATFWFTLPLPQETDRIRKLDSPDPTAHPTERRILLVDDNHVNLTLFSEILTRFGHTVTIANNGREAIDLARSSRPDAVLMDVIMPEMDGLEATRQLRAIPEFESLPIIAITGNSDPESLQQCDEAGCTMHLAKPVGMKELLEALRECLTEKEALPHE